MCLSKLQNSRYRRQLSVSRRGAHNEERIGPIALTLNRETRKYQAAFGRSGSEGGCQESIEHVVCGERDGSAVVPQEPR